ncbi:heme o synthase [Brevibacillus humidisoli]|uniref:heme o synthase n=1 Tax=Brevibacillus humidisoli TaxID=2895522 RepID=UPI001E3676F2|nr:heme o synthase [Brevibacillus humidisoli]UFJ39819.1 heme o synthase [Brevibacillus humidisoli]
MDQQATYQSDSLSLEAESDGQMQPATWSDYLHLTKPGITLSNLLTTFTGYWLAVFTFGYKLELHTLVLTLLGTAFVIASGATLNNYWDRELDAKMKRTKNRGLASGRIHPRNALAIGIALLVAGLIVLALFANPLTAVLGLLGHIFYVLIYTPLKRVTTLNTVIGGISGAIPPLIGWAAVTNNVEMGAWVLFLILFLWQPPHFLALAMLKTEEYRAGGIPMLPVVKGFAETKRQMFNYAAPMVPASLLLMLYANLGYVYLATALILGIGYLYILLKGFKAEDDLVWARKAFSYSLIYLTVLCFAIIVSAL